ncbi:hypothetical protein FWH09_01040, partial [Candidatus Saccharibacteria bacterium]|nr:hypothetical protein [Candidatus Saccharibacteria bacterium]
MQVVPIILIILALISMVLGAGLLSLWKKSLNSRPLSLMVLSISLWTLFVGLFLFGTLEAVNSFLVPAYYASAAVTLIFATGFALSYFDNKRKNHIARTAIAALSCVAVIIFCFWPNWLIKNIDAAESNVELGQVAYIIYIAYFILFSVIVAALLTINILRTKKASVKSGLKKVLFAWIIGGLIGSVFNLFLPLLGNYDLIWVGPPPIITLLIPLSSTLVTTVEHFSLIKTFLKGLIYFSYVAVGTFVVFSFTQFVSKVLIFAEKSDTERFVIIAIALVFLLPIIFILFLLAQKAIKKLDSDGYDENQVLSAMSQAVAGKHTPSEFLRSVRHELKKFFNINQVDVVVFGHNTAAHLKDSALEASLTRLVSTKKNQAIYCDDIKNKADLVVVKSYDIEVIVPITGAIDNKIVGAITLSPRERRFDRQYGETLERVSVIISPYIQSAAFYEQILGFNDKLKQEVRIKTRKLRENNKELMKLDEMKSDLLTIASHNLRTP